MTQTEPMQGYPSQYPSPPPRKRHRVLKGLGLAVLVGGSIGIGAAIGSAGSGHTTLVPVPGPTIVQHDPGVTKTVAPPPPAAGTTVLDDSGSGTAVTRPFTVGGSGDYIVSWTYSGNSDSSGPSNFIVSEDGGNDINASSSLPNDIAASGTGSTMTTGDAGTHTFNVQSEGNWTIKVVTAP